MQLLWDKIWCLASIWCKARGLFKMAVLHRYVEGLGSFATLMTFGDKYSLCKGPYSNLSIPMAALATGPDKGGGLLEKPVIEKVTLGRESEFDLKKSRKTAPPYRVILHNDNYNKREYVVQVLMKVIPGMTLDNAVNIMQEAHYNGLSVVIICAQADAEDHCMQLRGNGLLSSIEPASGGC